MRWVWKFAEGSADQKDLLGGKGANLAEMTRMGLPVPPGFTVTTEACRHVMHHEAWPGELADEVAAGLKGIEEALGRTFGGPHEPLLLSVRSGAKFSMPGMMDTVLNLGMNDEVEAALADETGDPHFAADAHRRFVEMFCSVVLGVPDDSIRELKDSAAEAAGVTDVSMLDTAALHALRDGLNDLAAESTGHPVPTDPGEQLRLAIDAVFQSWNGKRARDYRRMEKISDELGTAVNVQAMVFGNTGDRSGTGVAFTRDPSHGDANPMGDFLVNAQGEDVVAGVRATRPLADLADVFPEIDAQLRQVLTTLEQHYRDMCDIEFTIDRGTLFILQTRVGKRTAEAAAKIAVDMVGEGLIAKDEALMRFTPDDLERLQHPRLDPDADYTILATGVAASPGAAVGEAIFDATRAEQRAAEGVDVILVRTETSPDDLHGMIAAQAILTSRGGSVSHAAVVARGMGKPAVCGVDKLQVDEDEGTATVGTTTFREGDVITVDGTAGAVVIGEVPVITPEPIEQVEQLLAWADEFRRLGIRANADTAEDAERARANGAEGIGLCRTEHMFLGDRLPVVQRMILAETEDEERAALADLHKVQYEDFLGVLKAMDGLPVTVRLLDPPLHEFLPDRLELEIADREGGLDAQGKRLLAAVRYWSEQNPMLGVRGVRLAVLKPHLYGAQVRALIEATVTLAEQGFDPRPQIMIPLTVGAHELAYETDRVKVVVDQVLADAGLDLHVPIGTMIETPRAALHTDRIVAHAEFLSFGTNDLTQMTFGFSRDDIEGILMRPYVEYGLLLDDPFVTIDQDGVGRLMQIGVDQARVASDDIEIGICGEHGGEPASIAFCDGLGLDYVSCSPFRLPIARLTAARSALEARNVQSDEDH